MSARIGYYAELLAADQNAVLSEEQRRLMATRTLRREAQADEELEPIPRALLGIAGSMKNVQTYYDLAHRVKSCVGEPVTVIAETDHLGNNTRVVGGRIAGELIVRTVFNGSTGSAIFTVPVERYYQRLNSSRERAMVYEGANRPTVDLRILALDEEKNTGTDPRGDYSERLVGSFAIGWDDLRSHGADRASHERLLRIAGMLAPPPPSDLPLPETEIVAC